MPGAQLAQPLEKSGSRLDQVHVAGDRLDDDAGNGIAGLVECGIELREVVVVEHQRLRCGLGRHAGRARITESESARARLDEQAVGVAVIAAFELDDAAAAGESAGEPQCRHRRLGTRADEAHQLQPGDKSREQLGHLGFELGRRAEGKSAAGRVPHRRDDVGLGVPEHERPPGADVVEYSRPSASQHADCPRRAR